MPNANGDLTVGKLRALLERQGNVLGDGHPCKERAALEEIADAVAELDELVVATCRDIDAVDRYAARCRGKEPDEVLQGDGLSRSRRANDAEHLAFLDGKGHAVQDGNPVELLDDVAKLY